MTWRARAMWLALVAGLAFAALHGILVMLAPTVGRTLDPARIIAHQGQAYIVAAVLPSRPNRLYRVTGDSNEAPRVSRLVLLEDGVALGPAHSVNTDVEQRGAGRYSHWGGNLLFSASDGSDPRSNGRRYVARAPAEPEPWFACAAAALLALGLGMLALRVRARAAAGLGALVRPGAVPRGVQATVAAVLVAVALADTAWPWWSGTTRDNALAGMFPTSDAEGYWSCAVALGYDISQFANGWCNRRPLYPAWFATLLLGTAGELQAALLVQTAVLVVCLLAFGREVERWLGAVPAVIATGVAYWFAHRHAFGMTMTENGGLGFGLLGFALLLNGAATLRLVAVHAGVLALAVALNMRAGAFFVLPVLALWAGGIAAAAGKRRWRHFGLAVVAAGAGFALHALVVARMGGEPAGSHGGFAYALYGLSVGDLWMRVWQDLGGGLRLLDDAERSAAIYRAAIANILGDPATFFGSLADNVRVYVDDVLFFFAWGEPLRPALFALWWAGAALALLSWRDRRARLLALSLAGIVVSAAFIARDGGARVFAATVPVEAALVAFAAARPLQLLALVLGGRRPEPHPGPARLPVAPFVLLGAGIAAVALPLTPLRHGLRTPEPAVAACAPPLLTFVTRIGRGAPTITLTAPGTPATAWPVGLPLARLLDGYPAYAGHREDFASLPPIQLGLAVLDRVPGEAMILRFYHEGPPLPAGATVRLCVDPARRRSIVNAAFLGVVAADPVGAR